MGYDIVDGYRDISLLTNWGTGEDKEIDDHVMSNALIGDLDRALEIRDWLRERFPHDDHAAFCAVWAVYGVDT